MAIKMYRSRLTVRVFVVLVSWLLPMASFGQNSQEATTKKRQVFTSPQVFVAAFADFTSAKRLNFTVPTAAKLAKRLQQLGYQVTIATGLASKVRFSDELRGFDSVVTVETPEECQSQADLWLKKHFDNDNPNGRAQFGFAIFASHGKSIGNEHHVICPDDRGFSLSAFQQECSRRVLPIICFVDTCRSLDDGARNLPGGRSPYPEVSMSTDERGDVTSSNSTRGTLTFFSTGKGKHAADVPHDMLGCLADGLEYVDAPKTFNAREYFRVNGEESLVQERRDDLSLLTWVRFASHQMSLKLDAESMQHVQWETGLVHPSMIMSSRRTSFQYQEPPLNLMPLLQTKGLTGAFSVAHTQFGFNLQRVDPDDNSNDLWHIFSLANSLSARGKTVVVEAVANCDSQLGGPDQEPLSCFLQPIGKGKDSNYLSTKSAIEQTIPFGRSFRIEIPLDTAIEGSQLTGFAVSVPAAASSRRKWPSGTILTITSLFLTSKSTSEKQLGKINIAPLPVATRFWSFDQSSSQPGDRIAATLVNDEKKTRLLRIAREPYHPNSIFSVGGPVYPVIYADPNIMELELHVAASDPNGSISVRAELYENERPLGGFDDRIDASRSNQKILIPLNEPGFVTYIKISTDAASLQIRDFRFKIKQLPEAAKEDVLDFGDSPFSYPGTSEPLMDFKPADQ